MLRKKADIYAARLLMLCFFMPMAVQVTALLVAVAYFIATTLIDKYKAPASTYGWALCLSAGYYLYLTAFIFTPASLRPFLIELCGYKLSYLLLPFFFATIDPDKSRFIRSQLLWFVYGCIACCLIANGKYLYHFCIVPGTIQHLFHVQYRLYIEYVSGIHPTYISMYLCFSICILLLTPELKGSRTWVKYLLLYLLLIFLLSLLAKSALLALLIILAHYAYTQRKLLSKYILHIAGGIVALVAAVWFIPFFGQRMSEVLQFAGATKQNGDVTDNSMHVRKLVWDTNIHMLHQHWVTGVGPAALRHLLTVRYFFFSIAHNFFVGYYDPHNEYLFEWLAFGLAGIVVLLFVLGTHITTALRRADHLYLYLLIILCVVFSTESVLARQYGVMFYSILTSLFFFAKQQRGERV